MKPFPSHLYTLTGNLLWERTLEFTDWEPGQAQRARGESFQVGGKGVNVSKMLNRLGAPNTALLFAGGATGDDCLGWLRAKGFSFQAFPAERATRIGLVVRGGSRPDTTFFGPDAAAGTDAVRACAAFLDAQPDNCPLAICGSLPGWEGPAFEPLRAAIARWAKRGTICADTYGPPLAWLAGQPLSLAKINRTEFESLGEAQTGAPELPSLLLQARERRPVKAWIVTDGAGPVWLIDERGQPEKFIPPAVREVSATGSGDVFLACLLHARHNLGRTWAEAVAYAIPYAAANAAYPGIADFPEPARG